MTIFEAIISGVVQGLTEFLPVSSSGHLVLVHKIFNFSLESNLFFDICLHAATLLAVLVYFRKDILELIRSRNTKYISFIAVATIPAVLAGFFFENKIEALFASAASVAYALIATGIILLAGQFFIKKREISGEEANIKSSLIVGLCQACALIPGISRSGITVSSGLAGGMKPDESFKFSFLLSIPVIVGATLYEFLKIDLSSALSGNYLAFSAGIFCAFVVGLVSLRLLWIVMKKRCLHIFGIYCIVLGLSGILFWAK